MKRNAETQELVFDLGDDTDFQEAFNELLETPTGKVYLEKYYSDADADGKELSKKVIRAVKTLFVLDDGHVSVRQLEIALKNLILAGEIQPRDKEEEEPLESPSVDLTPRDKNGKPLTESQLRYQEYRVWSEQASSSEVNLRKQSDPGYASYVRKALQAELSSTPVGDGVTPEGQVAQAARNSQPAQSLIDFARKYSQEPVANLRPKGGFITLAGEQMPWSTYQAWITAATAAGAIR